MIFCLLLLVYYVVRYHTNLGRFFCLLLLVYYSISDVNLLFIVVKRCYTNENISFLIIIAKDAKKKILYKYFDVEYKFKIDRPKYLFL